MILYYTMKFLAATTALALATTSFSAAFVPAVKNPSCTINNGLRMSAVETPVYTFTKSEEVFKEALDVSHLKLGKTLFAFVCND
jgi:hypothetical protein